MNLSRLQKLAICATPGEQNENAQDELEKVRYQLANALESVQQLTQERDVLQESVTHMAEEINELRLQWQNGKPTEDGFYYLRRYAKVGFVTWRQEVAYIHDGAIDRDHAGCFASLDDIDQFAGPITQPVDGSQGVLELKTKASGFEKEAV